MAKCTVVGSGPSGLHFALSALESGHRVEMIDVGRTAPDPVNPDDTFHDLKKNLEDPGSYFLGENNEGVLLPGQQEEFYGIPPSQGYALETVPQHGYESHGFKPMFSFARGGLAQMWTGGCYPFNDAELQDYPFNYDEFERCYTQVAERIGINGLEDDLSRFTPVHDGLQEPLNLDEHSALLLSRYTRKREYIQQKLGCSIGRARQAVLSSDRGTRKACQYLGRCLWGCPAGSLYTPSVTLDECMNYPNFSYTSDSYVTHYQYDDNDHINTVVLASIEDGTVKKLSVDRLVLACGTLGTSKIVLESIYRKTGKVIKLQGLMDNRQVLVPFLNLGMIGRPYKGDTYQYNQLAMELENGPLKEAVHCLVTTLKTSMIHPVIEKFPMDLRTSLHLFRNIHAALGVVNVNFHDTRRDGSYLTLDVDSNLEQPRLVIQYTPRSGEDERISKSLKRIKKVLWKLGCVVPPGMVYIRPMGASVHYAGTLPMSGGTDPWTVSKDCKSNDFENLYIADGSTYPFLPAKNITFTLMANAIRVAEAMGKA